MLARNRESQTAICRLLLFFFSWRRNNNRGIYIHSIGQHQRSLMAPHYAKSCAKGHGAFLPRVIVRAHIRITHTSRVFRRVLQFPLWLFIYLFIFFYKKKVSSIKKKRVGNRLLRGSPLRSPVFRKSQIYFFSPFFFCKTKKKAQSISNRSNSCGCVEGGGQVWHTAVYRNAQWPIEPRFATTRRPCTVQGDEARIILGMCVYTCIYIYARASCAAEY